MLFKSPVIYLRRGDFASDGRLANPYFKNKIVVVMVYASWCPHCHDAQPDFQAAADSTRSYVFAAIQTDGDVPGERESLEILPKILYDYRGFPDYAYFVDGVPVVDQPLPGRRKNDIITNLKRISVLKKSLK
ncbi:hypothetical protein AV955_gp044 [Diadromus pulchellus ascovirus 4a]|uniref:Complete DpAV4 genome n=1 Tax=Diadromus pulchellus ascovirus 4a TaxID=158683 RepID=F2NYX3_9VIRU|nr:hypothetical protein AV955_gp044 [Diadromus pulchellus ascovirus 4a]CCA61401.1 unnamed protein product [Diadromus pulchellus ascovirus 4a]